MNDLLILLDIPLRRFCRLLTILQFLEQIIDPDALFINFIQSLS